MPRTFTNVAIAVIVAAIAGCSGASETVVEGQARDPLCGLTAAEMGEPDLVYRETRPHLC